MSENHTGNTQPTIDQEEHQGDDNSRRVNVRVWDEDEGVFTKQLFIPSGPITAKTGVVTTTGDNTILSVSAGNKVKLYHISFVPTTASGVDRDVVLKIGSTSIMGWRTNTNGGGFAHSPKNGQAWFEGADGEDVVLNLSGADSIRYNITYDLGTS